MTGKSYTCILAVGALVGALVFPGCGTDGAGVPSGNDRDATTPADATDERTSAATDATDATTADLDATDDTTTTSDASDGSGQTYVSLGAAASFVVLAGSTITNTGPTIINGNVGISPGSAITGFPPGVVNGVVHLTDAAAANAKTDLNAAYKDAASRGGAPIAISGDLGGLTLKPGLYVSSSSLALGSGDLTLDASGDQNAIWVFQIASTFVSTVNRKVLLINNAQADDVFWNVGSSATIGVGTTMVGNFLTQTSITVQTGATMDGRFLTQTGAVTFDSNTVNRPPPILN